MDNTMNDNFGIEDVQTVGAGLKNIAGGITKKAKLKKAKEVSAAGNYWMLDPYKKSLIPIPQYILDQVSGQGITADMVKALPAQNKQLSATEAVTLLKSDVNKVGSGGVIGAAPMIETTGTAPAAGDTAMWKKYLPWVFGILLIGAIAYAATHQAK